MKGLSMLRNFAVRILGLAACLASAHAAAMGFPPSVTRWHLQNVTFEDGGRAAGYFDWAADAPQGEQLREFDITVTGGDLQKFPAFTFNALVATPYGVQSSWDGFYDYGGVGAPFTFVRLTSNSLFEGNGRELRLVFTPGLSSSGGSVSIFIPDERFGTMLPGECFNCGPWRAIVGGAAIAAVPEPGTYALMLCGLALVTAAARRMSKRR